ncbi:MAG: class I SAM-dependent methyltransferase [Saprospiraceae bacterium]
MPVHYSTCPACNASDIKKVLTAEDHTVSHESFDIWQCDSCTLRFTQDVPTEALIGPYYQSEEYVSHSNTSKGLINGLYQQVRDITLSQKRALIREMTGKQTGSILDVGCGTGELLNTMKQAGWETRGLEPDEGARTYAKTQYDLDVTQPEDLFKLEGTYDCVSMWHVLEHVHRLHEYLDQLNKLIGEQGTLIIAVPNYTSSDAQHYGDKWAAYDVPRHLYHFSPQSMRRLLGQHGFKLRELRAMPFDAFYVSLLSEKYANGGMRPVSAFLKGAGSYWPSRSKPEQGSSVMYFCERA